MTTLDQLRQQAILDEQIPETVRKFLAAGAPLEDIRLNRFGQWFHEGEPFINQKLARLFHQSLKQTDQGNWFLHIAPYSYPVTVELTDLFIDRIQALTTQTQAHFVGTLHDTWTPIQLQNLYTDGEDLIAGQHEGRPLRFVGTAYRDLLEGIEEHGDGFALRLSDQRIPLEPLPHGFFHPTPR